MKNGSFGESTRNFLLRCFDYIYSRFDDIAAQVTVREDGGSASTTKVSVSHQHLIPDISRIIVTTRRQHLSRHEFDSSIAERINSRDTQPGEDDGRILYCVDLVNDQLMAALMYHVHGGRSYPLLITAIAVRSDGDEDFRTVSTACALILKAYLHALSAKVRRGATIGYDSRTSAETALALNSLGFRRSRPAGFPLRGDYLTQAPFRPVGLLRGLRDRLDGSVERRYGNRR
jgi:hypothetical protein